MKVDPLRARFRPLGWLVPVLLLACSTRSGPAADSQAETPDSTSWITVFNPAETWGGYTLAFYAHRIPILLDMNGHIVHRWPEARVKSRLRLNEDGSLLGIALGRGIVEYDWGGDKVWEFESALGFAHHDVIRLANGNTVTLIRPDEGQFDIVLEVNRTGAVVWQWDSATGLEAFVPPENWSKVDVTHFNSIQALPSNHWFDEGDTRFRPGNYLISAREMNLVFIVDKPTQEVVWAFETGLDKQHEPLMIGPGSPQAGNILLFNNRYRSFYEDRQSSIMEVNPVSSQIVWQYRDASFYSPTSGVQQPLPNGNVLITSSRGGRTFEITRGGHLVWEWAPPFDTTRSQRYGYTHSPQLAALGEPIEAPVASADHRRHIDTDVYRFARRGLRRDVLLNGKKTSVLKYNNDCRTMVVPAGAHLEVSYGLNRQQLAKRGRSDYSARFSLGVRPADSAELIELFEDTLNLAGEVWRKRALDLGPFALRRVALCLATEEVGAAEGTATEETAHWEQPIIQAARPDGLSLSDDELQLDALTAEELDARKKHLEALGYIN